MLQSSHRLAVTASPLEHLSMSSDDWSQAATFAWLLELKGNPDAGCTEDCLRIDMTCSGKQTLNYCTNNILLLVNLSLH